MKTLDIDSLKLVTKKIHYFGLGFVQVKVSDTARYNFYHENVPAFVDEPHDHRYDFTSYVVKGELWNQIWVLDSNGILDGTLENESCREGVTAPNDPVPVRLTMGAHFVTTSGFTYSLQRNVLHTVRPVISKSPVITYVQRGPVLKEYARVFRATGAEKVCPFSKNMPEDDLWAIVAECLRG